eukprot:CAMPEP_0174871856 /NCGR_PEP_ID=MMETSP1114-20130205/72269_1 /TAXON_ID=312471 /ORGANISM="Neobodo designis, Strain CCAP 1951/1" /LENGTH=380 /DNA_ID=CAMNT_0016107147 /DNA_START=39 /DNA_END=1178 /DNA_ORIENTATION=-
MPRASRRDRDRLFVIVDHAADAFVGQMVDATLDTTAAELALGPSADPAALLMASSPPPSQGALEPSASQSGLAESSSGVIDPQRPRRRHQMMRGAENAVAASLRIVTQSVPAKRDRFVGAKAPKRADAPPEPLVQRTVAVYAFIKLEDAKRAHAANRLPDLAEAFIAAASEEARSIVSPPPETSESALLFTPVDSPSGLAPTGVKLPESVPPARVHFVLVHFNGTSRPSGSPKTAAEASIGAHLVLASPHVAGVTFVGTHGDVAGMLRPAFEYALKSMAGKGADEIDASALTDPQSKGPKVSTDWGLGYQRMLCEIPGISESRVRCVTAVFPTMASLILELKQQPPLPDPPAPVTEAHLSARFAALAQQHEGSASARGAD